MLEANPDYTGPGKSLIETYTMEPFTSQEALLNALKSGQVDVAQLAADNFSQIPALASDGFNIYGTNSPGVFFTAYYNFENTTGNFNAIISQLYMRQALAHLEDHEAVISLSLIHI